MKNRMKKILYILPIIMLLFMTTFVIAGETAQIYSLRSAPCKESKNINVNIYSNGDSGGGYIIKGLNDGSRITYYFQQINGDWQVRKQKGDDRGKWKDVTVTYEPGKHGKYGTWSFSGPCGGFSVKVVNLI